MKYEKMKTEDLIKEKDDLLKTANNVPQKYAGKLLQKAAEIIRILESRKPVHSSDSGQTIADIVMPSSLATQSK